MADDLDAQHDNTNTRLRRELTSRKMKNWNGTECVATVTCPTGMYLEHEHCGAKHTLLGVLLLGVSY